MLTWKLLGWAPTSRRNFLGVVRPHVETFGVGPAPRTVGRPCCFNAFPDPLATCWQSSRPLKPLGYQGATTKASCCLERILRREGCGPQKCTSAQGCGSQKCTVGWGRRPQNPWL